MPELPTIIDDVTDVKSDSSNELQDRGRQSLPLKSIRDSALSNFNTFKALNKCRSVRPTKAAYQTSFIHLT